MDPNFDPNADPSADPNLGRDFDPFEDTTTGRGEEPPEDITVQALGGAGFGAQNGAIMPVGVRRVGAPLVAGAFALTGTVVLVLLILAALLAN